MTGAHSILTLAHSPDPDDVFMWWPLTGMIDPRDPSRVVEPPELNTGRWSFRALPADIAELNRRAITAGDLDITALSMFTFAHVQGRYVLTACGSSVGVDYGPKLVAKAGADPQHSPGLIAVPGVKTTAFACLCMHMGWARESDWAGRVIEMPFDRILEAVATGHGKPGKKSAADRPIVAGLLIHQSQLTYRDLGLVELIDFGRFWKDRTGLPLPLGGNALRRDLDKRFGHGATQEITDLLHQSIMHALSHRDRSTRYAMQFAPEITRPQADRYIDMYVNDYTVALGQTGNQAVHRLIGEAAALGLCPSLDPAREHILWPGGTRPHT